jgi:predicted ATPase
MFLRAIRFRSPDLGDVFPFSIPAIRTLDCIELRSPVTFFAGENGTGKSTLLEGIASGAGSISVRGDDTLTEQTLMHAHALAEQLTFQWSRKTHRGFFLRAEDFFDYAKRMARLTGEMEELAADFDEKLTGYGRHLARGSALGQRSAIVDTYGGDLNDRSHGESFLRFFQARFAGEGLYLLDEPDTALSPQSVLGLLVMLKDMVQQGAQFIIATHSPMLMAFPGASILSFDRHPVAEVSYDEVDQNALMRSFLNHPEAFLRHL